MGTTREARRAASDGRWEHWRNPVLRFEGTSSAPPEGVYELLADLRSHLDWAGQRQLETTRLLTMNAPSGPATVGTEFRTTGSDGKVARFSDRSVVTEATRPQVFEFVTESRSIGEDVTTCVAIDSAARTGSTLVAVSRSIAGAGEAFSKRSTRSSTPLTT